MKGPVGAFAGLIWGSRHFDEAVVETERVPDRVLPSLLVLPVKREQVHDKLVNVAQSQHFRRRVLDGHRDQRDVRVRRLGVSVRAPIRLLSGVLESGDGGGGAGQTAGHGGHGRRGH